ncbi:hypothetical protein AZI11_04050 [Levilactobacillus brevis]|nr:hypothetical protein AZI11_04050 [Levilactobacillus brevis]ARN94833.1 hypothetical protein AZI12_04070 [Levilactobacillus brevis]
MIIDSTAENSAQLLWIHSNLVIMKDKQAVTGSLQVADTFGKEHRNVLANIGGLLKNKHTQ